jgi:DNA adenine methylase
VEPFAGSLAVLLAKVPALIEVVNDLDHELVTFWRVLQKRPDELARACALTPHARAEYEASKVRPGDLDELEKARRVWVKLSQGRGGTLRNTGWRHFVDPHGTNRSMGGYLASYVDRMSAIAERLSEVYADPPYLAGTRSGTNYACEMPSEDEHRALAAALHDARAAVVLSGYASPLYAELYGDWHTIQLSTRTGQAKGDQRRTEVLWCNRAAAPDLFSTGEAS